MTISITATGHGTRGSDLTDDIVRAEAAARAILDAAGIRDTDAYAAYQAQWDEFDGEDQMRGAARVWIEARQAADVAITEGWANPGAEVFCEMSAW